MSDDFINSLLRHTKHYESPTSFWKWAAFTTVGTILRDNCYRRFGDFKIYPNLYTLLIADSAVHRKANPIKICESLVTTVNNTKVISGRTSIQAILDELSRSETNPKTGALRKGGSALFSAGELAAGIVGDDAAISVLTDIYDFKDEYVSRLRGMGIFRIKNVCFSMMVASNETLLMGLYDHQAINGGLIGRTFVVKPDEFRKGNSLWDVQDNSLSYNALVSQLREISRLEGQFDFDPFAQVAYDEWYYPFRESYSKKPDKSGILGRIHTSIIKLSMILAVNYTRELYIRKEHIEEAIEEGLSLLPNYQSFIMATGKSTIAETGRVIISELWEAEGHVMSRKNILKKHWLKLDTEILDKTLATLVPGGVLEEVATPDGVLSYRLTEGFIESLGKGLE